MRAMPAASLRSLLLICILSTALAWRASVQITGKLSCLSPVHSYVAVGPVSRPIRIALGAFDLTNAAIASGSESTTPSRTTDPTWVHHTDRCLLQRHVQSDIMFHRSSPSLRGHMRIASCLPGELIPCAFVWHDPGITPCCRSRRSRARQARDFLGAIRCHPLHESGEDAVVPATATVM
jgi:hypothetical protein